MLPPLAAVSCGNSMLSLLAVSCGKADLAGETERSAAVYGPDNDQNITPVRPRFVASVTSPLFRLFTLPMNMCSRASARRRVGPRSPAFEPVADPRIRDEKYQLSMVIKNAATPSSKQKSLMPSAQYQRLMLLERVYCEFRR
jgi:hypothetical protein